MVGAAVSLAMVFGFALASVGFVGGRLLILRKGCLGFVLCGALGALLAGGPALFGADGVCCGCGGPGGALYLLGCGSWGNE